MILVLTVTIINDVKKFYFLIYIYIYIGKNTGKAKTIAICRHGKQAYTGDKNKKSEIIFPENKKTHIISVESMEPNKEKTVMNANN